MKLDTHLYHHLRWNLLKTGAFRSLFLLKPTGFRLLKTSVIVDCEDYSKIEIENLPYDMDYYNQCAISGIHLKHWTSRLRVRRDIYTITIDSATETLTVTTKDADVYEYLSNQFRALHSVPDRTIHYNTHQIVMDTVSSGISLDVERVVFDNIAAYRLHEDVVTLTALNEE